MNVKLIRAHHLLLVCVLALLPVVTHGNTLERIRASLADPACPVRNITELALDYGFVHLGRFSDTYRQLFGELPSDTLKRRH